MSNKYYKNTKLENEIYGKIDDKIDDEVSEQDETLIDTSSSDEHNDCVPGVVVKCHKLNIREAPNMDSNSLCVVNAGTELTVDVSTSTDEWYHVNTDTGLSGYCVRQFVETKTMR